MPTKPEDPAQEPPITSKPSLLNMLPAPAVSNSITPATPAPSQPAGAREDDAEELYRVSRRGFEQFKVALAAFLAQQTAAKDAEWRTAYHVLEDRAHFQKERAELAERERDSLRVENAALKVGKE